MRGDRERLYDIAGAAEKVASRVARGRSEFDADEDLQLAMTKLLEIIGEAAGAVSEELRSRYPTIAWRQAASARNRTVHGYFDIDLNIVWQAASEEVPALAEGVRNILDHMSHEEQQ